MSANVYECMFLLDSNKIAGDVHAAQAQLHSMLEKHSAEILASRPWDERRLAYPVSGHKKGLYYLTYFKIEGKKLLDIEQDVALNETILRSMVLRIEPKLVDTMLAIARDEHATALPSGTDTDSFDGGSDDGHRRGRRSDSDKD
jgi:small subunit ribosomal protein S6